MTVAHEIAVALLSARAVLFQPDSPFTFASGIRSPIYCDNRLLIGDVAARTLIGDAFAARCAGAEVVVGTATAGIPWAAWAAERAGLPMAYVRGVSKGHGRGRQIEGASVDGRRVVLLEDTISTGESALAAAAALRADSAELLACFGIFGWGWGATAARFASADLPMETLTTLDVVLDAAIAAGALAAEQRELVESWARDPQGWSASSAGAKR